MDLTILQQQVNDLAMKCLLGAPAEREGGAGMEWTEALGEVIRESAAQGFESVAAQSRALERRLRGLPPGSPELQDALENGIRELQEALENPPAANAPAAPLVSLVQDPELVADFVLESREHLRVIEANVLALEHDPGARDPIHAMFRAFHTIKGIAGFLEFHEIRQIAHETETLLDETRNGRLEPGPAVIDVILESADFLDREIQRIESGRESPAPGVGALPDKIRSVMAAGALDPNIAALAAAVEPEPARDEATRAETAAAAASGQTPGSGAAPGQTARAAGRATSWVKVDTAKLDFLVDMVGEMIIAQSLVRHNSGLANMHDTSLARGIAQLSRITEEVQKTTMSMRMLPVGGLFQKMGRLVRDLCRKSGKQAELVTAGEDTELDRNIVEQLADPLMHMVRNSMDHGVEPPQERIARGKPPVARIELRAAHQGGHIIIEIADDGRGVDRQAILKKARERHLVADNAALADAEILNLIFEPGFSTAAAVTDISGRGVGMDVVKRHIQKLRGRVEISTVPGRGTTFALRLPLTLAIIDGLLVGVGAERYIVPIFAVKEAIRPAEGMVSTIEGRHEVALVRGRILPVVRLHRRFGVTPKSTNPEDSLLIITESQGAEYALLVDELLGKQEVVIKSLGETFRGVAGVGGGAILGDGKVGLILEMNGIFHSGAAA
jgi:two-component system, chemotaxis family, sensor kinase CheA